MKAFSSFRMLSKKIIWNILWISISLFSCGPPKMISLKPRNTDTGTYVNGHYYIEKEQDSVFVKLAFLEQSGNTIGFDLLVNNESTMPVNIFPEQIFLLESDTDKSLRGFFSKAGAIDPEQQIASINAEIEKENKSYGTYAAISAVGGMADFIFDLATIGRKENKEEMEKREVARQEQKEREERTEIEHRQKLYILNVQKNEWSEHMLRKNTVFRKQSVCGKVLLPFYRQKKYATLVVPVHSHLVKFEFDIKEYFPR